MPRGVKKEITYTGKAAKLYEKIQKLEAELKNAKDELKIAYKEQLKEEKRAAVLRKKEQEAAIVKALGETDKSLEEIMAFLSPEK